MHARSNGVLLITIKALFGTLNGVKIGSQFSPFNGAVKTFKKGVLGSALGAAGGSIKRPIQEMARLCWPENGGAGLNEPSGRN